MVSLKYNLRSISRDSINILRVTVWADVVPDQTNTLLLPTAVLLEYGNNWNGEGGENLF